MPDVNQTLYDLAVSHQIGLQRLSTATVRKLLVLVARVHADVVSRLSETGTDLSVARLEILLNAIKKIMDSGYTEINQQLADDAVNLAIYESEYQSEKIPLALPPVIRGAVDWVVPAPQQLAAATLARPFQGRLLREWGQDLSAGAFNRVRDAIRIGFVEGQTTADIVQRIRGTKDLGYKDGVLAISQRGAESLARTALNHTANYAREETAAQNADIVKSVRWVSTLDMRTSAICRARDGMEFPINSGPRPPAHWSCRSCIVPVTKSWSDLGLDLPELPEGTRASMNGQVPASETYQTWIARQTVAVQNEVLGVIKARLFRKGGVTLDRFVDKAGNELTIDQLRQRDRAAFVSAGLG